MDRIIPRLSAAERTALVAAARTFLTSGKDGGPAAFGHRGRLPWKVDCLGMVRLSFSMIGHAMQDRASYGRDPSADGLSAAARAHFGEPVYRKGQPLSLLQPGDVVLMQWHNQPNHVAIVTDYPHGGLAVIHSLAQARRVIEHRLADPWPRRILEGFR